MKEKPIIFSAPMVRALLGGRKAMTRRVLKHNPFYGNPDWDKAWTDGYENNQYLKVPQDGGEYGDETTQRIYPRYYVGDRLWVKETWRPSIAHGCAFDTCDCGDVNIRYAADNSTVFVEDAYIPNEWTMPKAAAHGNVSPLFMPRWASRISLEVISHRVERVQDITEEDAVAEGCYQCGTKFVAPGVLMTSSCGERAMDWPCHSTARCAFETLWRSIHGYDAWFRNDWVEVVGFRRIA